MIKEYLAQLHILNAIEVAVYRLQMNVFYDKRLHKIIIFKSESGKKNARLHVRNSIICNGCTNYILNKKRKERRYCTIEIIRHKV